jgi:hypothetical protein
LDCAGQREQAGEGSIVEQQLLQKISGDANPIEQIDATDGRTIGCCGSASEFAIDSVANSGPSAETETHNNQETTNDRKIPK